MLRLKFLILLLAILFTNIAFASGTENRKSTSPVSVEASDLQISVFQNTEDHRYIVSFKNETDKPVSLDLKDKEGQSIYTEMVKGKGIYNKRFDLINLVDGEYTVTVGNEISSLVKDLVIK